MVFGTHILARINTGLQCVMSVKRERRHADVDTSSCVLESCAALRQGEMMTSRHTEHWLR